MAVGLNLTGINLLSFTVVGLIMMPMLFCCYQTKKRLPQAPERDVSHTKSTTAQNVISPTSLIREPHVYDDANGDSELPQLPDRQYLTDIDFVSQEFDLILRRPPELPGRPEEDIMEAESVIGGKMKKMNQFDVSRSDCKSGQELSWKVTSSARPNKYNLTVPNAHVNKSQSQNQASTSQAPIKRGQPPHGNTRYQVPAIKANKGAINTTSSLHHQPVSFTQQQPPHALPSSRPLPYRQTAGLGNENVVSQVVGNKNEYVTYQNIAAQSTQTIPDVFYQNVTADQQMSLQDENCYENTPVQQQEEEQQQPEGTYQPLIFGGITEDEYMDVDMFSCSDKYI